MTLTTFFERHLIEDEAMGLAYESAGPAVRASLKKTIALVYRVWGESPLREGRTRRFADGFALEEDAAPAPFCLYLCDARYPSSSAFAAALMPSLLSGVERVYSCFLLPDAGAPAIDPALLAALELAGVEQGYACEYAAAVTLLPALRNEYGAGRVVFLHGRAATGEELAVRALRSSLPFRAFTGPLCCARPVPDADGGDEAALSLGAGYEDVWLWPDLEPAWFHNRRMRLSGA